LSEQYKANWLIVEILRGVREIDRLSHVRTRTPTRWLSTTIGIAPRGR